MDIVLLGNGFDLHHNFPTSYLNFLNTAKFLIDKYDDAFTTVGDVFGNQELQEKDLSIKKCYDRHSNIYHDTNLPKDKVANIITNIERNVWFKYLCNSVSKDIKWIDFEKEVSRVLEAFFSFFNCEEELYLTNGKILFNWANISINEEDKYILSQFNVFFECVDNSDTIKIFGSVRIKPQYIIEKIKGSNIYHLAVDNFVSYLYMELRRIADALRDYLLFFVDEPAKVYADLGMHPKFCNLPENPKRVYTFNYTNTFETLYNCSNVKHIHGKTDANIVLGINPNKNDNIGSIDTTFLQFKKYFQRAFYKTDIEFLRDLNHIKTKDNIGGSTLYVVGHSLDSTDEDIIKKLFELPKSICVLYHNDVSVKNQIKNLVEIYGKNGFDKLREEKNLKFFEQSEIKWQEQTEQ